MTWVRAQDGLQFGDYGTIRSSGTFQMVGPLSEAASSIEMWFEPALTNDSNTMLAFSTLQNPMQFSLHQHLSNLIIKHEVHSGQHGTEMIRIDNIFRQGNPVFVTVTSGAEGTATYVDGVFARGFPHFRLADDFTGQLEIGTSPVVSDAWQGILKGLAVYYRQLTAPAVQRHYKTWTKFGRPEIYPDERVVALYLFNEHAGKTVHNALHPGIDLDIPKRYSLLHQIRFEPFWEEYKPIREHWRDILLNVIAFIPFGFALCASWGPRRPVRWTIFLTTCFGFAVSLAIEFFQSYLPTRNSGTTDLFTNSLGTFVGARAYASITLQDLLAKRGGRGREFRLLSAWLKKRP